jgi:ribosomal-protein-alanine N-acetyltransferase
MKNVIEQPTITTERLLLRPYTLDDAPELQRLIGEWEVARTLMSVPYPYPDGAAEEFINARPEFAEKGEVQFAITHRNEGYLIGGIGLNQVDHEAERAEIGYWIAKQY